MAYEGQGLTRRGFIGLGSVAVLAAGAAGLTGCAQLRKASESAAAKAETPGVAKDSADETKQADIAIVGAP